MRHKTIKINIPNRNNANQPRPPVRNKTRKTNTPSKNNAIMTMYNNDYYGTELLPMSDILNYINEINEILVLVNKEIKKHIVLNNENRDMFRKYNFIEDIV